MCILLGSMVNLRLAMNVVCLLSITNQFGEDTCKGSFLIANEVFPAPPSPINSTFTSFNARLSGSKDLKYDLTSVVFRIYPI